MSTRAEPYRHVALPPPALSLLAPDVGGADLFLAAYSTGDDGAHHQLHLTDLVREPDLALAWHGLESAYTFSSATFALMQRLGVSGSAPPLDAAPSWQAFAATMPFYTHDAPAADGSLLVLTFAGERVSIDRAADARALAHALARGPARVAARRVATVFWHIHM